MKCVVSRNVPWCLSAAERWRIWPMTCWFGACSRDTAAAALVCPGGMRQGGQELGEKHRERQTERQTERVSLKKSFLHPTDSLWHLQPPPVNTLWFLILQRMMWFKHTVFFTHKPASKQWISSFYKWVRHQRNNMDINTWKKLSHRWVSVRPCLQPAACVWVWKMTEGKIPGVSVLLRSQRSEVSELRDWAWLWLRDCWECCLLSLRSARSNRQPPPGRKDRRQEQGEKWTNKDRVRGFTWKDTAYQCYYQLNTVC